MTTLGSILSTISACGLVKIMDSDDSVVFHGLCQDFRVQVPNAHEYLNREVWNIYPFTGLNDYGIAIELGNQ